MDGGGNGFAEDCAVALRHEPGIGDHNHAPVAPCSDQAAKALPELYDGFGQCIVPEGTATFPVDLLASGLDYRIADLGERQAGENHARKRLARDIHPLPEGLSTEEHRRRTSGRAELASHRFARHPFALDEQPYAARLQLAAHARCDGVHHLVAREEHERAALGGGEEVLEKRGKRLRIRLRVCGRVGQAVRRKHERLPQVVEWTFRREHPEAVFAAQALGHVAEAVADPERSGTEDDGVLELVDVGSQRVRDGKRRANEPYVRGTLVHMNALDPVGVVRLVAAYREVRLVGESDDAFGDCADLGGEISAVVELAFRGRVLKGVAHVVQDVQQRGKLVVEAVLNRHQAALVPLVLGIGGEESVKRMLPFGRTGLLGHDPVADDIALLGGRKKPLGDIRQFVGGVRYPDHRG